MMGGTKKPAGVEISIKPLSKAKVDKLREAPGAKAGDKFRKTLPGKKR
jgi:hypothetical protein